MIVLITTSCGQLPIKNCGNLRAKTIEKPEGVKLRTCYYSKSKKKNICKPMSKEDVVLNIRGLKCMSDNLQRSIKALEFLNKN